MLVDLEILIAPEARSARKELAQLDSALTSPRVPVSLHYVGTPSGLGSLIADIRAAEVADGVTLLPLALPRTLEHLVDSTIPWLQDRGLVTHRPPQSTRFSGVSDCPPPSAHACILIVTDCICVQVEQPTVIRRHRPPVPESVQHCAVIDRALVPIQVGGQ